jgi:hypothetical protein
VGILADGRQLSQGGSDWRGHMAKLPADLVADRVLPVGSTQTCRLGGIRGGPQGVSSHMRDACGLAGCSGGGRRCRSANLACGAMTDETASDLLRDPKLTAGEGACPGDGVTGAGIPRSFGLERS